MVLLKTEIPSFGEETANYHSGSNGSGKTQPCTQKLDGEDKSGKGLRPSSTRPGLNAVGVLAADGPRAADRVDVMG